MIYDVFSFFWLTYPTMPLASTSWGFSVSLLHYNKQKVQVNNVDEVKIHIVLIAHFLRAHLCNVLNCLCSLVEALFCFNTTCSYSTSLLEIEDASEQPIHSRWWDVRSSMRILWKKTREVVAFLMFLLVCKLGLLSFFVVFFLFKIWIESNDLLPSSHSKLIHKKWHTPIMATHSTHSLAS